MTTESNQIYDLQKEWRAIVLDKLSNLEKNQSDLKTDISDMKTTFANQAQLATLQARVDTLEKFKAKALGFIIAFNFIGGVLGWIISTVISASK